MEDNAMGGGWLFLPWSFCRSKMVHFTTESSRFRHSSTTPLPWSKRLMAEITSPQTGANARRLRSGFRVRISVSGKFHHMVGVTLPMIWRSQGKRDRTVRQNVMVGTTDGQNDRQSTDVSVCVLCNIPKTRATKPIGNCDAKMVRNHGAAYSVGATSFISK